MIESSRNDRAQGVACLIGCPAISGLFLGLVAIVCAYPAGDGHTIVVGAVVAVVAFVANALAICLTASGIHRSAVRRARYAARCSSDSARGAPSSARISPAPRAHYAPWPLEERGPALQLFDLEPN